MEISKHKIYFSLFKVFTCIVILLLCGCQKKIWEYDCNWISEEPYIFISLKNYNAAIEIDGVNYDAELACSNDGRNLYFYKGESNEDLDETVLWEAEIRVNNDKLYLTVMKDNVSDYEGEEFVLERQ